MSKELIERLEKAESGSRELDEEIVVLLGGTVGEWGTAPVTRSLDVALALAERVLPGWNWCVGRDAGAAEFARYRAWVQSEEDRQANPLGLSSEAAPTAPLALCIAILKAQGAQQ